MATAELECGTQLHYESVSFLPARGEVVPCRNHGYCPVRDRRDRSGRRGRAARRQPGELAEYMADRLEATIGELRRERFTLRLLAEAERCGELTVDLLAGVVRSHPSGGESC